MVELQEDKATQNVPVKKDVAVEDVHAKGITCPAIHVVIQELVATTMSEELILCQHVITLRCFIW